MRFPFSHNATFRVLEPKFEFGYQGLLSGTRLPEIPDIALHCVKLLYETAKLHTMNKYILQMCSFFVLDSPQNVENVVDDILRYLHKNTLSAAHF